jgi:hypothetical protein
MLVAGKNKTEKISSKIQKSLVLSSSGRKKFFKIVSDQIEMIFT